MPPKSIPIVCTCTHCGRSFERNPSGALKARYCSRKCYADSRAKSAQPYQIDAQTGCWVWQRACQRNGYGKLWRDGKLRLAHRCYFEDANGTIPDGMSLHHTCANRSCVNPDHLEVVTTAGNLRQTVRSQLTAADVQTIRALAGTMMQKDIAARFGVNRHHISNILAGRVWRDD